MTIEINMNMGKKLANLDFNKGAYWILYFLAAVSAIYAIIAFSSIGWIIGLSALIGGAVYFALAHHIRRGNVNVIITAMVVIFIDYILTSMNAGFFVLASILKLVLFLFILVDYLQKKRPNLLPF